MAEDFSPQQLFELYQRLWSPSGSPLGALPSPFMSVEEVDKKIQELKLVDQWLSTNLEFLRLTVKTLEFQKVVLTSMGGGDKPDAAQAPQNPFANPELWPWNLMGGQPSKKG